LLAHRWGLGFDSRSKVLVRLELLPDFFPMVEIVGQCGVDLGQTEVLVLAGDLLRSQAVDFVVANDVLDADSRSGDAGSAPTAVRAAFDVFGN